MITVTALNHVRCSLPRECIAAVEAGSATVVRLTNGLTLDVRESVEDVLRALGTASPSERSRRARRASGARGPVAGKRDDRVR